MGKHPRHEDRLAQSRRFYFHRYLPEIWIFERFQCKLFQRCSTHIGLTVRDLGEYRLCFSTLPLKMVRDNSHLTRFVHNHYHPSHEEGSLRTSSHDRHRSEGAEASAQANL